MPVNAGGSLVGRSRFDYLDFGRRPPRAPPAAGRDTPAHPPEAEPPWLARFVASLGGQREEGPEGPRLVVRRQVGADEPHGGRPLGGFVGIPHPAIGWLGRDPALGQVDLERAVFLDCETTGLAGGTGTKAFLVGLAWFAGGALHVEQHFLPDYDAEPAFLAGITRPDGPLARAAALVTFNGKTFDLPLLETRLALHRRRADWLDLPHLDLLHPARRVWRRRLESCGLTTLEERVLGLARGDDAPGWLIPTLYFGFLRTGDLAPLAAVFEHNRRDLLGLVALGARLGRLAAGEDAAEHPLDALGLARLLEDAGEAERAVAGYERALLGELSAGERDDARARLGLLYKRLRRETEALAAWDAIARGAGGRSLLALVELAKHHEHRARNYARAAAATRQALLAAMLRPESAGGEATAEALERRLRRLEAKLTAAERASPG